MQSRWTQQILISEVNSPMLIVTNWVCHWLITEQAQRRFSAVSESCSQTVLSLLQRQCSSLCWKRFSIISTYLYSGAGALTCLGFWWQRCFWDGLLLTHALQMKGLGTMLYLVKTVNTSIETINSYFLYHCIKTL